MMRGFIDGRAQPSAGAEIATVREARAIVIRAQVPARRPDQLGFTLIEVMGVIAILGVLVAVAVTLVGNFLREATDEAYQVERGRIQAALDGYFCSSDNPVCDGRRQYPLIGRYQTAETLTKSTSSIALIDNGDPFESVLDEELWNPLEGAEGADLTGTWSDANGDGVRTVSDSSEDRWLTVTKTHTGQTYHIDPRYYFIDFEELVDSGWLDKIPDSAATDNAPEGSTHDYTGSYIWYVDHQGEASSLLGSYPFQAGFVEDVFP